MSRSRRLATIAVAVAASLLTVVPAAIAAPTRSRIGSAPPLPAGARRVGTVPEDLRLHLTVALAPSDPAGLERFATGVSTPGSPEFREYLSVGQFAQQFGATPAQIAAVAGTLRASGLEIGEPAANHLTLPLTGTAAEVEAALAPALAEVRLADGTSAYANRQAPTLPAAIAPYVQGIVGLDDLSLPQPLTSGDGGGTPNDPAASRAEAEVPQVATGGPQPCLEAQELRLSGAHTADELASAYQFSSLYGAGDLGAGQTIALIEFEPYLPPDIAAYQACYATSAPVVNVEVDGGPGPYLGEDTEAALDIETVIGAAPQAGVLVYQAPNRPGAEVDVLSTIVSENRAKVISTSWGQCEPFVSGVLTAAVNVLLQEAAAQGQSFFSASGDTGSQECLRSDEEETARAVQNPSSQPFATGVGGTSLVGAGPPPAETVWNDGFEASGGGTSSAWSMPAYQASASPSLNLFEADSQLCGGVYCREVPDVAADADGATGYIIYANKTWIPSGGTSAAAPLWAAFTALANAQPACRGRVIGFANPALYSIAGANYAANFHDVVSPSLTGYASNDTSGLEGPFPIGPGYDMTTGLGTPVGPTLAASLCALASPVYTVTVNSPGNIRSSTKRPVAVQITGGDSGGQPLAYSASGLPPGLSMTTSGAITGVPSQVGTSTVTVSASDPYTNGGSTQFQWSILRLRTVHVAKLKLRGIAGGRPRLSFAIAVGKSSPRVQAIKVKLPHGLSFSAAPRSLATGVTIVAKHGKRIGARARVRHGDLLLKLAKPAPKLKVNVRWPALRASAKLVRSMKGHKRKLKVMVGATDTAGHGSRFALVTKAR